jgi:hypothetical protein
MGEKGWKEKKNKKIGNQPSTHQWNTSIEYDGATSCVSSFIFQFDS